MTLPEAHDLMRTFSDLCEMLGDELEAARTAEEAESQSHVLDAFLAGAALNQILEDDLHRDFGLMGKAANRMARGQGRGRRFLERGFRAAVATGQRARIAGPDREALAWQRELADVVDRLASLVAAPGSLDDTTGAHRRLMAHLPAS
ncbi:MAG: hypothetical protein M3Z13_00485, partial [Candidatus Dormibacteraeota bacterium]|nr:hypothetical protein [Candidatus Dormibacteraeota bacterium]